jgi:4,5-DOPA dioxygenase extradiol
MNRNTFLKLMALSPFAFSSMNLNRLKDLTENLSNTERMPLLFVGHGSPMNAIEDNPFTRSLRQTGKDLLAHYQPKAIMVVSAHWLTKGTFAQMSPRPEIIYDFGGFPQALSEVKYPAIGSPETAKEVTNLVSTIHPTQDWGLDHGSWTILKHLFPQANVPVFQLSIDYQRPMSYHFELAQRLSALRDKGILIIGSGNVVHNLPKSFEMMQQGKEDYQYDWAITFDNWVKNKLNQRDFHALTDYTQVGQAGTLSVPTPDHYIPLLYNVGMASAKETLTTVHESVVLGGISMRTFRIG